MPHAPAPRQSFLDRERTLRLVEAIGALTHLVSGLEYLADDRDRRPGGLNDSGLLGPRDTIHPQPLRRLVQLLGRRAGARALQGATVAASLVVLLPTGRRTRAAAHAFLAATKLANSPNASIGSDGSDQVSLIISTAAAMARAGQHRRGLVDACLWFLASISALNYGASGISKVCSPMWRTGPALTGVMRTRVYGDPRIYQLLKRYPVVSRLLTIAVLAMESLFPLALVGPGRRIAPLFVGSAGAFHAVNAKVMGLNRFLTAFVALHPAVLYAAGPRERLDRHGTPERRDDGMLAVLGLAGLVAVAGSAAADRRRGELVRASAEGERDQRCSSGDVLRLRRTEHPDPTAPLIVLEHGQGFPTEYWHWVGARLAHRGSVLTYRRAGYGASTLADPDGYTLDVAVADLVDLVRTQAGDRPVLLAGHLLGGYVVAAAAGQLGERVLGVVLVDCAHPVELQRSDRDDPAPNDAHERGMRMAETCLRLGLGALADAPLWLPGASPDLQPVLRAHHHDLGSTVAHHREWRAARAVPGDGTMPRLPASALVLVAESTTEHPSLLALQREFAAASPGSRMEIVPECRGDNMLVREEPANRIADLVEDYLDERRAAAPTLRSTTSGEAHEHEPHR